MSIPFTTDACVAIDAGTNIRLKPSFLAVIAIESKPFTARTSPESDNSPAKIASSNSQSIISAALSMPISMGKS